MCTAHRWIKYATKAGTKIVRCVLTTMKTSCDVRMMMVIHWLRCNAYEHAVAIIMKLNSLSVYLIVALIKIMMRKIKIRINSNNKVHHPSISGLGLLLQLLLYLFVLFAVLLMFVAVAGTELRSLLSRHPPTITSPIEQYHRFLLPPRMNAFAYSEIHRYCAASAWSQSQMQWLPASTVSTPSAW